MIQPKTKFRFSVQNHDFWQALEGSDHFMPPPYQRAQYDIPTKVRLSNFSFLLFETGESISSLPPAVLKKAKQLSKKYCVNH